MNNKENLTYLFVGLGNPGKEHRRNRHNVGFMLLDLLAAELGLTFRRRKSLALITDGHMLDRKVILAKPQTFMNLSGRSVGSLMRFYRIPRSNLLIAYDELDLPSGSIRLLPGGGSAGHKGMRSIIEHLATQDFPRLRIGIGRPPGRMDPSDYVLQDFSSDELVLLEGTLKRAVECLRLFISEDIQAAMTCCNTEDE
jgi:PTH1 family peptidyl-tRNA hydrolase